MSNDNNPGTPNKKTYSSLWWLNHKKKTQSFEKQHGWNQTCILGSIRDLDVDRHRALSFIV